MHDIMAPPQWQILIQMSDLADGHTVPFTRPGHHTSAPPNSAKFENKLNLSQATYNIFSDGNCPLHVVSDIFSLAASASLFCITISHIALILVFFCSDTVSSSIMH